MQNFTDIPSTRTLSDSLAEILNNDKTAISCSSGAAFPTANLQLGMLCFRTDQSKLYILKATSPSAVWVEIMDVTASSGKAPNAEAVDGIDGAAVVLKSGSTMSGALVVIADLTGGQSKLTAGTLELNSEGLGNRFAFIDFHGDDTYADFSARLIRGNAGPNSNTDLVHRGTGSLRFITQESGAIELWTGSVYRGEITADGRLVLRSQGAAYNTHAFNNNEGGGEITINKASDGSVVGLFDFDGANVRFIQAGSTGDAVYGLPGANSTGSVRIKRAGYLDGIVMDSAGRVTMQYQPAFYAGKSNGDWTGTCLFNDVRVNTGGHYSTSTGRFTAPIAGRYAISVNSLAAINNSTGHKFFAVRRNGASIANVYTYVRSGEHAIMTSSFVYELAAGDYIDVTGQDGAFYGASTLNTNFSAYLLG